MLHRHCLLVTLVAAFSCGVRADVVFVDVGNCPGPGNGSEAEPYCSIQTAIDNALDTDEIVVAPGTYFEAINFLGKAITLRSTDPGDPDVVANTVIDGTGFFHVVQCVSGERLDTVLDGFTITGGNANGAFPNNLGGGMLNNASSPIVTNCTFSGNTADNGGGMHSECSSPTVNNCTFAFNSAGNGNAIGFDFDPSDMSIVNCILWNGGDEIWNNNGSTIILAYSDVQGGFPGTGNIDADPLFIDPLNGDFRLLPGSACVDAGHNWGVPPDIADVDADGDTLELTPRDLDGNPRFVHAAAAVHPGCGIPAVVDMGAYELPDGTPADIRLGDIDGNGTVNLADFVISLNSWGPCEPGCCLADLDLDGTVGITDFLLLLGNWG